MLRNCLTFNQYIVHIGFHIPSELVCKNFIYQSLVGGSSIFQTKGYNFVTIDGSVGNKSRFLFIFLGHSDLIISGESIHERHQRETRSGIHQQVNVWERIVVLWASFVQVGIINIDSPFPIGFFDKYNIREPFGVFDFAYESDLKEFSNFLLDGLSSILRETSFFLYYRVTGWINI